MNSNFRLSQGIVEIRVGGIDFFKQAIAWLSAGGTVPGMAGLGVWGSLFPSGGEFTSPDLSSSVSPMGSAGTSQQVLMTPLQSDNSASSSLLSHLRNKDSPQVTEGGGFVKAPALKLPCVEAFLCLFF